MGLHWESHYSTKRSNVFYFGFFDPVLHSACAMAQVFRVLYIEENVNEKAASQILQDSTRLIAEKIGLFIFFVVPNAFRALELIERTAFDMIIMQEFVKPMFCWGFTKILNDVKCTSPIILLKDRQSRVSNDSVMFKATLQPGYSSYNLCDAIITALNPGNIDICKGCLEQAQFKGQSPDNADDIISDLFNPITNEKDRELMESVVQMATHNMDGGFLSLQEKQNKLYALNAEMDPITESSLYSLLASSPNQPTKRKRDRSVNLCRAPTLLPSTDLASIFDEVEFENMIFHE